MTTTDRARLLADIRALALEAGAEIMRYYQRDTEVRRKSDKSPVTAADEAAERLIVAALRRMTPDIPVIAEEEAAAGESPPVTGDTLWLVDPLDGTREFIRDSGEFTVNIALIEAGRPVLGVVHAPALGETYTAAGPGTAWAEIGDSPEGVIAARRVPAAGATVMTSRSHANADALDAFCATVEVAERRPMSSSIKFCVVARGDADLYPCFHPIREWDTAAGHAVLIGAGGDMTTPEGGEIRYGRPDHRSPNFIAHGA